MVRIEIDGADPSAEQLAAVALDDYGHFTTMQVRSRRVRGLSLHLARLTAAHSEMFGHPLDGDLAVRLIRHAMATEEVADATVRVLVRHLDDRPSIMITIRPPGGMPGSPWRLRSVPYLRPAAHLKHLGDFGQAYYQRQVKRDGYDEALLTGPDGVIAEGSITNIGFFDGAAITWPDAPVLAGITMQLVQQHLGDFGLTYRNAPVHLTDVASFDAAFVTNARGIAPVAAIDEVTLPVNIGLMARLDKAYESASWDRI
ncbi:MAG TPA: aminotransferase class IV [Streptosporangiaceae bacterium]|jgi:branched-subunit amino acid aminotransferase/4-amino-4-deoxychorismate lyase